MSSLLSPCVQNENINNENMGSPDSTIMYAVNSDQSRLISSPLSLSDSLREEEYNFPESPDVRFVQLDRKSYIPSIPQPEVVARCSSSSSSRSGGSTIRSKMDPRSWLEVLDEKHRYSKNLRAYHREWYRLGEPKGDFFTWLDSTDHEIEECPRSVLDMDTVHYCSLQEVGRYELSIDVDTGLIRNVQSNELVNTGSAGWIFVLRDDVIVAAEKKTSPPRFHHSSFFAGACVEVAGIMVISQGKLERLYPHSGHYRPREEHVKHMLNYLAKHGIDLSSFEVDVQYVMKISRPVTSDGSRIKKRECPHYLRADDILSFLTVKMRSDSLLRDITERNQQAAAVVE